MTARLFGEVSISALVMAFYNYSKGITQRAEVSKVKLRYFSFQIFSIVD